MLCFKRDQIDKMIGHAKEVYPYECCGIIAGKDERVEKIVKIENKERSSTKYSMDDTLLKQELERLDEEGLDFIGVYHSHPTSKVFLSETDISKATFPELDYVIISLLDKDNPEIRNYKIKNNVPNNEFYTIAD